VQSTYVSLGLDSIENIGGREQDYNRPLERCPNFQEMTLSVSADVSRRTADVGMDVSLCLCVTVDLVSTCVQYNLI
jgi:hypothetical protein